MALEAQACLGSHDMDGPKTVPYQQDQKVY